MAISQPKDVDSSDHSQRLSRRPDDELKHGTTRKLALDLGSGNTKCLIADVTSGGVIRNIIVEKRIKHRYSGDLEMHDGVLSEEIQAGGIALLKQFMDDAKAQGATEVVAWATEWVRKALNGDAYLARVNTEIGLNVTACDQIMEAKLGLETAAALGADEPVISLDTGSGSFQIMRWSDAGTPESFMGRMGTTVAFKLLRELQGVPYDATDIDNLSPGDPTAIVSLQLAKELADKLEELHCVEPPAWLQGAIVYQLGDTPGSRYAVTLVHGSSRCVRWGEPGAKECTLADVQLAMEKLAGQRKFEEKEAVPKVMAKICLTCAILKSTGIRAIRFIPGISGGCPGLLKMGSTQPLAC